VHRGTAVVAYRIGEGTACGIRQRPGPGVTRRRIGRWRTIAWRVRVAGVSPVIVVGTTSIRLRAWRQCAAFGTRRTRACFGTRRRAACIGKRAQQTRTELFLARNSVSIGEAVARLRLTALHYAQRIVGAEIRRGGRFGRIGGLSTALSE
jgi:hypothetical protein